MNNCDIHSKVPFIHESQIDLTSQGVIRAYEAKIGRKIDFPIPVEEICELLLELDFDWHIIPDSKNCWVCGVLDPCNKKIHINELHIDDFKQYGGLLNFTIAHEIGHWTLHVDSPAPRHGYNSNLPEGRERMEIQANLFAGYLLMPTYLYLPFLKEKYSGTTDIPKLSKQIGVSQSAMRIQIAKLIERGLFVQETVPQ